MGGWSRRPVKEDFAETQLRDDKDRNLVTEFYERKKEIKIAFQISSLGDRQDDGGAK